MQQQAFEKLFKEHYSSMYSYSMVLINDSEECRDLVSEAFTLLWNKRETTQQEMWPQLLHKMVRNLCVDHLRHKDVEEGFMRYWQFAPLESKTFNPETTNLRETQLSELEDLMDKLPERTLYILRQCFYLHRSYADVAQELGITTSGVKKHIIKALKYLRENVNQEITSL